MPAKNGAGLPSGAIRLSKREIKAQKSKILDEEF